jgi:hypothetical protein
MVSSVRHRAELKDKGQEMIITVAKLAFKVARSKKTRKAARKVAAFAKENVSVDMVNRTVDIAVGGRTMQLSRETFKREQTAALPTVSDPFEGYDPSNPFSLPKL